jgi:UDP-3-O-[3-hydroxymyristoyl] N-acetylglucosamine deacetylase
MNRTFEESPLLKYQRTLRDEIQLAGVGLHTGYSATLRMVPAPPDTGIVFRRTDLGNFAIEAVRRYVAKVSYATTLMKKGVMIATVEHLLSSLYGLGIDNVFIDLNSMEVPILDGSGECFARAIEEARIAEQRELRRYIVINEPIEVRHDDKVAGVYPAATPSATYIIDFDHRAIGRQEISLDLSPEAYRRELSPARTFGFASDVAYLKECGLIRGGSLDNAVVLDENGIVNSQLRFPDEFVRHKLLDLLGDISLVGFPLIGHLHAEKAGHAIHATLADRIARERDKFRICTLPQLESPMHAQRAG